ncbi:MAG: hypothetical protein ACJ8FY_19725 [Gemmataceae bacterium]
MDTVTPETTKGEPQNNAKSIKKNNTTTGKKPTSKGTMREPPQQAAPAGPLQDAKEALQEVEETKGDWSKGG